MARTGQTRRRVVGSGVLGGVVAALAACAPSGGGEAGTKAGGSGKQVTVRLGSRANGTPGDVGTEEFLAGK